MNNLPTLFNQVITPTIKSLVSDLFIFIGTDDLLTFADFIRLMDCIEVIDNVPPEMDKSFISAVSLYHAMDENMDQELTLEEIEQARDKIPKDVSFWDIYDIIDKIEIKTTNALTEAQFLELLFGKDKLHEYQKSKLRGLYNVVDSDHNGTLSVDELNVLIGELYPGGCEIDDAVEIMVKLLDSNGDDELTLDEFVEFAMLLQEVDVGSPTLTNTCLFSAVFKILDKDNDKALNKDDLEKFLRVVHVDEPSKEKFLNKYGKEPMTYATFMLLYGSDN